MSGMPLSVMPQPRAVGLSRSKAVIRIVRGRTAVTGVARTSTSRSALHFVDAHDLAVLQRELPSAFEGLALRIACVLRVEEAERRARP